MFTFKFKFIWNDCYPFKFEFMKKMNIDRELMDNNVQVHDRNQPWARYNPLKVKKYQLRTSISDLLTIFQKLELKFFSHLDKGCILM